MNNSQELAKAIKNVAKSKKVPIGKMLHDCNLSINTLSSMQSGGYYPRLEALSSIADYLDCSIDYLLGRVDEPELGIKKAPLHGGAVAQDNILRLAGRDGRYLEKTLTPEQIDLFFKMLEQLPDADNL